MGDGAAGVSPCTAIEAISWPTNHSRQNVIPSGNESGVAAMAIGLVHDYARGPACSRTVSSRPRLTPEDSLAVLLRVVRVKQTLDDADAAAGGDARAAGGDARASATSRQLFMARVWIHPRPSLRRACAIQRD